MSTGGGHPGQVVKFKVLKVKPSNYSVLLEVSPEDVQYFADKVGKNGVGDFRFSDGGEHHPGSQEGDGPS